VFAFLSFLALQQKLHIQWRIQGGGPGPPIFGKVNLILIFLHCIQCLKTIFLKLNLDFIVAEIRGVFGSVGRVCVCV